MGFNPFQGLWNVLTLENSGELMFLMVFQSLSGIMERSHWWLWTDNRGRMEGFQSLSGIMERSHGRCDRLPVRSINVSIPFRDYGTFSRICYCLPDCTPQFQSLSGIMERSHLISPGLTTATSYVSIPFRDYGTFSPSLWPLGCWPREFQSLSGIMERSHKRREAAFNVFGICFNPFQGLWNVLTRASGTWQ